MAGRWQHEGVHAGTPADPVVKHLDGIPWYTAPTPRGLHRKCRPQTVELWWAPVPDGWFYGLPKGGRMFCRCGATLDLQTGEADGGWVGRNSRRSDDDLHDLITTVELPVPMPPQRIESPNALSVQSGVHVNGCPVMPRWP